MSPDPLVASPRRTFGEWRSLARESLRSAIESVLAHGFRSFLTIVGIAVGVASVVAVVALVQGLQQSVAAQFEGLGGNSLSVASFTAVEDGLQGKFARLTPEDMYRIASRINGIASITPLLYSPMQPMSELRYGSNVAFTPVRGTTHSYQDVYQAHTAVGRFLSVADDRRRRRVCVLGDRTREALGLADDPVGEYVGLAGEWLKVIGVMERQGEFLGMSQDDYALVPYRTMQSLMGHDVPTDLAIQLTLAPGVDRDYVRERIGQVLRRAHGLRPGQADDFKLQTPDQITDAFAEIGSVVTAVVGGIVGISLLVGGIGIMNIMLVSVTERTREIGIQKALGATRVDILMHFLTEAVVLALLGGLLGLLLGYGLGTAIAAVVPGVPSIVVPLWAVGLAIGFSSAVGVVFGILPASRAAELRPIDALRYE